jgi:hypothetical protein
MSGMVIIAGVCQAQFGSAVLSGSRNSTIAATAPKINRATICHTMDNMDHIVDPEHTETLRRFDDAE